MFLAEPGHFAHLAARYVTESGRMRYRFAICSVLLAFGVAAPGGSRVRVRAEAAVFLQDRATSFAWRLGA
ncbi:hypothetical protein D0T12_07135 [Actinomadura spongiicola]|uniref:Uncharacterized protein n=1 Tax=Actinomadura spongiicola TaxID=2303421 RepID=A0A372GMT5_9ACTN|nr:hypothetical protein D0T12_07135 [Actinomadura spongiicola]